tara:strand:+ start:45 stop:242 length:198 start_codon:yes stop_codon:yes gene_type:complete
MGLKKRKESLAASEDKKELLKCPKCRGHNVEERLWVNVNTLKVSEGQGELDGRFYCVDCETIFYD